MFVRSLTRAILLASLATCFGLPVQAQDPRNFKPVAWDDLYANPERYRDSYLIVRKARCFAADKEDFRCASPDGAVLLSTWFVERDEDRERLEKYCDTVAKAFKNRQCVVSVHFSFLERATMDTIGPRPKRLIRAVSFDIHP